MNNEEFRKRLIEADSPRDYMKLQEDVFTTSLTEIAEHARAMNTRMYMMGILLGLLIGVAFTIMIYTFLLYAWGVLR